MTPDQTGTPVEGSKYTFYVEGGKVRIDRHGEPWISNLDCAGGIKAIMALIGELEDVRRELAGNKLALDEFVSKTEWVQKESRPATLGMHRADVMTNEIAELRAILNAPSLRDVLAERHRQIEAEGFKPEHDDAHDGQDLAEAAACYCVAAKWGMPAAVWPWDQSWWKPGTHRRNLIKAGALILAEIERLDRRPAPPIPQ